MKIISTSQISEIPADPSRFTGSATIQRVLTQEMATPLTVDIVNFNKGVRNKFHSHSNGQMLIVTIGKGIVATEKDKVNVKVGDIIWFPPGEKHWHGAAQNSKFSHIVVQTADSKVTTLED